jgi:PhzF family phenazine biosynthesis protein
MKVKMYQVDAFSENVFGGNPAAVCILGDQWLDEESMQNIAMENNLSETAFYSVQNGIRLIRWFTPKKEVDLCGHATLATAYMIFKIEKKGLKEIEFMSKSGSLKARKDEELITLDFPSDHIEKISSYDELTDCFNIKPKEVFKGNSDYMLIYPKERDIINLEVDFDKLSKVDTRGVIVTAKGDYVDFVSRFFAPRYGVNEDPVTGSAHTTLTNYWSKFSDKKTLTAKQLSPRGGKLICSDKGNRVEISGKAILYFEGEINVK